MYSEHVWYNLIVVFPPPLHLLSSKRRLLPQFVTTFGGILVVLHDRFLPEYVISLFEVLPASSRSYGVGKLASKTALQIPSLGHGMSRLVAGWLAPNMDFFDQGEEACCAVVVFPVHLGGVTPSEG
jgi:hypothetical protein